MFLFWKSGGLLFEDIHSGDKGAVDYLAFFEVGLLVAVLGDDGLDIEESEFRNGRGVHLFGERAEVYFELTEFEVELVHLGLQGGGGGGALHL